MVDNSTERRDDGSAPRQPVPLACATCGTPAQGDAPPATWVCSVEGGDVRYLCERCARENIRSIEGRLDTAWW
ncbi:hypothetical protein [Streptomyces alkaliterrae]|uniref:Uncharacterized protein n=1 Tax=Streptomyces alkaliterrae TaxID=2213162 RepID=A0A5P0YU25_9ACTN|nr:hypothetical protein [Streptomyces alkaliterrae]MBB1253581.1 hypothetical protein [Streptomyces alkaliterrae]MBB1259706.1 hypothetical protein [Streptomyces alkaliterrae]MQS03805.1 hypothetical protein [Streptomyces alkaliterrae]